MNNYVIPFVNKLEQYNSPAIISPTSAGIPNLDDTMPNAVATIKKTRMASVKQLYENL